MKRRMKSKGGFKREHTIADQSQESTGSSGGSYGMPKGPLQKMAGAAKKGMTTKVRR